MGKASRLRRSRPTGGPYFHGGAPGLNVGEVLVPATLLGLSYQYFALEHTYDPDWVYVTTDEGVAAAYASRHVTAEGRSLPGDLYEVQPLGEVHVDPDYDLFPEVFFRGRRARVLRRVATGVALTRAEQAQRERRYNVWGRIDAPVWDDEGIINPSAQMLRNGVTRHWTSMLRPWTNLADIDGRGRLTIASRAQRDPRRAGEPWATFLDVVAALDRDCQIQLVPHVFAADRWRYRCQACGTQIDEIHDAARHQLGPGVVAELARIHGWDEQAAEQCVWRLARAAWERDRPRWDWVRHAVQASPSSG
jgi:hypothetical protein